MPTRNIALFQILKTRAPCTMRAHDAATKFLLGSNTKLFTAVAIMKLVEEGALRLSSPLRRFLPRHRTVIDPSVTLHHLLSHTAGVVDFWDLPAFDGDVQSLEIDEERLVSPIVHKNIFDPLGMTDSGIYDQDIGSRRESSSPPPTTRCASSMRAVGSTRRFMM